MCAGWPCRRLAANRSGIVDETLLAECRRQSDALLDEDARLVCLADLQRAELQVSHFAFDQAARRQAELRAIHVFDGSTIQIMANLPQADVRRLHVNAADTLHELLGRHAQDNPGVLVSSAVLSGAPATTLTSAAADAELLVLGSRGHGDVATLMLGSTSHTVLHNATCPVAVVRGGRPFAFAQPTSWSQPERSAPGAGIDTATAVADVAIPRKRML